MFNNHSTQFRSGTSNIDFDIVAFSDISGAMSSNFTFKDIFYQNGFLPSDSSAIAIIDVSLENFNSLFKLNIPLFDPNISNAGVDTDKVRYYTNNSNYWTDVSFSEAILSSGYISELYTNQSVKKDYMRSMLKDITGTTKMNNLFKNKNEIIQSISSLDTKFNTEIKDLLNAINGAGWLTDDDYGVLQSDNQTYSFNGIFNNYSTGEDISDISAGFSALSNNSTFSKFNPLRILSSSILGENDSDISDEFDISGSGLNNTTRREILLNSLIAQVSAAWNDPTFVDISYVGVDSSENKYVVFLNETAATAAGLTPADVITNGSMFSSYLSNLLVYASQDNNVTLTDENSLIRNVVDKEYAFNFIPGDKLHILIKYIPKHSTFNLLNSSSTIHSRTYEIVLNMTTPYPNLIRGTNINANTIISGDTNSISAVKSRLSYLKNNYFDHVRIGYRMNFFDADTGKYLYQDASHINRYLDIIDYALGEGFTVIMDAVHYTDGNSNIIDHSDLIDLWTTMIQNVNTYNFANNSQNIVYEVINEPHATNITMDTIFTVINNIHTNDSEKYVMFSGFEFPTYKFKDSSGNEYGALTYLNDNSNNYPNINDEKLIATFHYYEPRSFSNYTGNSDDDLEISIQEIEQDVSDVISVINTNNTNNFKIYVGEIGSNWHHDPSHNTVEEYLRYRSNIIFYSVIAKRFRENNYGVSLWESFPLSQQGNRKAIVEYAPENNWYNDDIVMTDPSSNLDFNLLEAFLNSTINSVFTIDSVFSENSNNSWRYTYRYDITQNQTRNYTISFNVVNFIRVNDILDTTYRISLKLSDGTIKYGLGGIKLVNEGLNIFNNSRPSDELYADEVILNFNENISPDTGFDYIKVNDVLIEPSLTDESSLNDGSITIMNSSNFYQNNDRYVLSAVELIDGSYSQLQQTFTMNITSLPNDGADVRVFKTNASGGDYISSATTLQIGTNTKTTNAVSFDRVVRFWFSSELVEFDSLSLNGVQIYP